MEKMYHNNNEIQEEDIASDIGSDMNRRCTVIEKRILAWSQRWGRATLTYLDLITEDLNGERPK